jgi:hypothetical protein
MRTSDGKFENSMVSVAMTNDTADFLKRSGTKNATSASSTVSELHG